MGTESWLWRDRSAAGAELAAELAPWRHHPGALVVGLPRGGVAVAAAVAEGLGLPLVPWAVRKIGHPHDSEFAIGAVAPGGVVLWSEGIRDLLSLTEAQQAHLVAEQQGELRRRQLTYGDPPAEALRGHPLIVVDDGVATGLTVRAALVSLAALEPASLTLAVPVMEDSLAPVLEPLVDHLVVLERIRGLRAVGLHYLHFPQLDDGAVIALLQAGGRLQVPAERLP